MSVSDMLLGSGHVVCHVIESMMSVSDMLLGSGHVECHSGNVLRLVAFAGNDGEGGGVCFTVARHNGV